MRSDYQKRTHDQLIQDVNAAWDLIKRLKAENDRLQREVLDLKRELSWKQLLMTAAGIALWELVKYMVIHG
jgi:hypothetical protein